MGNEAAHVRFRRLHRWIALTATHEELVTRIAQEVHKSYKKNQVFDDGLLDLCRSMDELYEHAQHYQKELEDEMCVNRFSSFFARYIISRNVSRYKRLVAEQAQDLGIRAIHMDSKVFTNNKRILGLCKRARQCREAADNAWEEIVKAYQNKDPNRPTNMIEAILGRADKVAQRMLSNNRVRGVFGRFISYRDVDRDEMLDASERIPIYEQEETEVVPKARPREASSTWLGDAPG